jgi:hypothetical protein
MHTAPPPAIIWTHDKVQYTEEPVSIDTSRDSAWEQQEDRLLELRRLPDNWDDEGGRAPAPDVAARVSQLLREFRLVGTHPAPSRIVPTPDGGLILEWQMPGLFATLEITQPFSGAWLIQRDGEEAEFRVETWAEQPLQSRGARYPHQEFSL